MKGRSVRVCVTIKNHVKKVLYENYKSDLYEYYVLIVC